MRNFIYIAAAACVGLCGCAGFAPQPQDIPLAAVIKQVRADLQKSMKDDPITDLPLTTITLNLKVAAVKNAGGSAEVTTPSVVPVDLKFSSQTTGTMENTVTLVFSGKDSNVLFGHVIPMQFPSVDAMMEGKGKSK